MEEQSPSDLCHTTTFATLMYVLAYVTKVGCISSSASDVESSSSIFPVQSWPGFVEEVD